MSFAQTSSKKLTSVGRVHVATPHHRYACTCSCPRIRPLLHANAAEALVSRTPAHMRSPKFLDGIIIPLNPLTALGLGGRGEGGGWTGSV